MRFRDAGDPCRPQCPLRRRQTFATPYLQPALMTHASVAGSPLEVPGTLIRLSVGIEHPEDLVEELARALG